MLRAALVERRAAIQTLRGEMANDPSESSSADDAATERRRRLDRLTSEATSLEQLLRRVGVHDVRQARDRTAVVSKPALSTAADVDDVISAVSAGSVAPTLSEPPVPTPLSANPTPAEVNAYK